MTPIDRDSTFLWTQGQVGSEKSADAPGLATQMANAADQIYREGEIINAPSGVQDCFAKPGVSEEYTPMS